MDDLLTVIDGMVSVWNTYFWRISFVFLIGLGIVFTIKLKGMQITHLRDNARLAVRGVSEGKGMKKLSAFEAFCISMGARIGVGNIAGVATAIATGGPGAVFWMWIFAIIGSASSFMESVLAQIYKEQKTDGGYHGGPAYYATKGLKSRKIGVFVAILLVLTFGVGFVMVQSCNATNALCGAFEFENNTLIFASLIAVIAAVLVFGGFKLIGKFSASIVPVMALLWIIFAIVAICFNIGNLGNAIAMIFRHAFDIPSIIGGGIGTIIITGLKRGVFSNEAGLGSIANIAATSDIKHPIKQGKIQSFGVLVDTLVVCTVTALVVLSCGSFESILAFGDKGSVLVQDVVSSTALGSAANYIIAIFMFVFAFTSMIGYYTMSESNARFVKDNKLTVNLVRIIVILSAFIASVIADVTIVDDISDTFMAAMAAVNMVIVALLSRSVFEAYADYRRQRKAGIEEPEFTKSVLSNSEGVTEWE
ncbi:MAG: alanine:cation symporter family protein [Candidatus Methanomethylophilaceae archaeon]|nr:alanine:cation symporter family protein [Candidatus Methanomethylophilaceae archaeon]